VTAQHQQDTEPSVRVTTLELFVDLVFVSSSGTASW
jgi:low temperature requirement protein LtrA